MLSSINIRTDLKEELLSLVQAAIDAQVIPELKSVTRVDTGELQASTRTQKEESRLYIVQGGKPECDYAVWIELRYGDFSNALSSIDWNFR